MDTLLLWTVCFVAGGKNLYIFFLFSPLNMDTCEYKPFLMPPSVSILINRVWLYVMVIVI